MYVHGKKKKKKWGRRGKKKKEKSRMDLKGTQTKYYLSKSYRHKSVGLGARTLTFVFGCKK